MLMQVYLLVARWTQNYKTKQEFIQEHRTARGCVGHLIRFTDVTSNLILL